MFKHLLNSIAHPDAEGWTDSHLSSCWGQRRSLSTTPSLEHDFGLAYKATYLPLANFVARCYEQSEASHLHILLWEIGDHEFINQLLYSLQRAHAAKTIRCALHISVASTHGHQTLSLTEQAGKPVFSSWSQPQTQNKHLSMAACISASSADEHWVIWHHSPNLSTFALRYSGQQPAELRTRFGKSRTQIVAQIMREAKSETNVLSDSTLQWEKAANTVEAYPLDVEHWLTELKALHQPVRLFCQSWDSDKLPQPSPHPLDLDPWVQPMPFSLGQLHRWAASERWQALFPWHDGQCFQCIRNEHSDALPSTLSDDPYARLMNWPWHCVEHRWAELKKQRTSLTKEQLTQLTTYLDAANWPAWMWMPHMESLQSRINTSFGAAAFLKLRLRSLLQQQYLSEEQRQTIAHHCQQHLPSLEAECELNARACASIPRSLWLYQVM